MENPPDRGVWWATVHGVGRIRYNLGAKQPPLFCHYLSIHSEVVRKGHALHFQTPQKLLPSGFCPHHCSEIMLVHVPRDSHAARAKHHFVVILPATKLCLYKQSLAWLITLSFLYPIHLAFILRLPIADLFSLAGPSSLAPKAGAQSSYILKLSHLTSSQLSPGPVIVCPREYLLVCFALSMSELNF